MTIVLCKDGTPLADEYNNREPLEIITDNIENADVISQLQELKVRGQIEVETNEKGLWLPLKYLFTNDSGAPDRNREEFESRLQDSDLLPAIKFFVNNKSGDSFMSLCCECAVYCEQVLFNHSLHPLVSDEDLRDLEIVHQLRHSLKMAAEFKSRNSNYKSMHWFFRIGINVSRLIPMGQQEEFINRLGTSTHAGLVAANKSRKGKIVSSTGKQELEARVQNALLARHEKNPHSKKTVLMKSMSKERDTEGNKLFPAYSTIVTMCKGIEFTKR